MSKRQNVYLCNASPADAHAHTIVSRLGHLGFWEGPAIAGPGFSAADNGWAGLVSIVCLLETAKKLGFVEA